MLRIRCSHNRKHTHTQTRKLKTIDYKHVKRPLFVVWLDGWMVGLLDGCTHVRSCMLHMHSTTQHPNKRQHTHTDMFVIYVLKWTIHTYNDSFDITNDCDTQCSHEAPLFESVTGNAQSADTNGTCCENTCSLTWRWRRLWWISVCVKRVCGYFAGLMFWKNSEWQMRVLIWWEHLFGLNARFNDCRV